MPVTALKVPRDQGVIRTKVVTTATEHGLLVELYNCDSEWREVGNPERYGETVPEDQYHKALRMDASIAGHYIPEESTDPEWNPNYKEETENENRETREG